MKTSAKRLSLILAVAFAGCVEDEDPAPVVETPEAPAIVIPEEAPVVTHAEYGYLTMDELVEGGPETFPSPGFYNGSNPPGTPYYWTKPLYHSFGDIPTDMSFLTRTNNLTGTGHGIAVYGPLAVLGNNPGPMNIVNILDPQNPQVVSVIDSPVRDADFIAYPDGRLVVVSTSGGGSMVFTDVTDPYNPEQTAILTTSNGNHNLVVVPGTPFVYSSQSGGEGGATSIVNAEDPRNPVEVKNWANGYGCHDATFYMNAQEGKYRGYCAGIEKLQIWNLTDPANPTVISEWGWPALGVHDFGAISLATFAHLAIPNHDASILILGDETGGGAAPGCDFSANVGGTTVTGPLGNLWFYDISDETNPQLRGSYSPSVYDQRGSCTAHFGRVIEDTNHVVMGFYSAGVVMVDFRDPQNPVEVAHYEQPLPGPLSEGEGAGSIWDVWYYQGYLFTGDMTHGLDVLTVN